MMREALDKFGAINRRAPDRILFYRDGLSEGEYEVVGKKEIGAIESAIDAIWQARGVQTPKPAITFIVVGKRHHVRFFPDKQQADRSGNCPAGFVADRGIGNPVAQDFYLLSHGGLLGTSRPSHYIVLRDDIYKQNIGDLQELSFALCHAYARATRSVSIPAPVYYADIVCARAAFHFDSRLDYDNSMTVSDEGLFNIDEWKSGYRQLNGEIAKTMYFI
ncbi:hypothetical protein SERLADRAFT_474142 [Serpula lacrymans var. lacrymans S7.9]|uniref:Piwi domain-containing protein n=1 Tax=Serpula lacrymans var. lacrymans (strain S7.9) TaxID=578457 RepID=F8P4Q2_SERL9|nr:uncharacterized protein SERLADRAFT_474142 [Serpula lacrymans var. lacrymans S7.9]EGO21589.1 hypothetical protein SERLADRAFT_474142 [Serpula lacrymans var. lacrymans S7.9]